MGVATFGWNLVETQFNDTTFSRDRDTCFIYFTLGVTDEMGLTHCNGGSCQWRHWRNGTRTLESGVPVNGVTDEMGLGDWNWGFLYVENIPSFVQSFPTIQPIL